VTTTLFDLELLSSLSLFFPISDLYGTESITQAVSPFRCKIHIYKKNIIRKRIEKKEETIAAAAIATTNTNALMMIFLEPLPVAYFLVSFY
jgi:hypothetical protein